MKKTLTKLLTLLGVFLFLGAGQVSAWTVYYTNPEGWENVKVYVFGNNQGNSPAKDWDGAAMTYADGIWSYTYNENTVPGNIIFNDGKGDNQTGDLSFGSGNNNKVYATGKDKKDGPVCSYSDLKTYTVYFNNNDAKWSKVYAYSFDGATQKSWPGHQVTTQDSNGNYKFVVKALPNSTPQIVWNGGDNSQKLRDLPLIDGQVYCNQGYAYKWFLVGDFNKWGADDTYKCEQEYNSSGTFTWQLSKMSAGEFKFRKNNDGWYQYSSDASKYRLSDNLKNTKLVDITSKGDEDNAYLTKDLRDVTITVTLQGDNNNVYMTSLVIDGTIEGSGNQPSGTGTGVFLQGINGTWSNQPQYEFAVNNSNEYKLSLTLEAGDYEVKVFYEGALRGYIPEPAGYNNTIEENKDLLMDYKNQERGQNFKFNLSQKSTVNFYYKKEYKTYQNNNTYYWTSLVYSTNPLTAFDDDPDILYLYGHINGGYWKHDNFVPLEKIGDKKYYAENVEVTGLWKQKDSDLGKELGQNRPVGTSTRNDEEGYDLQYVALYAQKATDDSFDDAGIGLYKFGSVDSENNEDNNTNCRVNDLPDNTASILWQGPRDRNNFIVSGGFYNVTVDLETGKVTFEEVKEEVVHERTFNWWFGNDDDKTNDPATLITENTADVEHIGGDFDDHAHHSFTYGDTQKNVVQVGIKTMPEHRLAQQATYTIWYADPSYNPSGNAQNIKRRVDSTTEETGELDYTPAPAIKDITKLPNDGKDFQLVTPNVMDDEGNITGPADAEVTTIGNNKLGTNYLLQLNKAGYYVITADADLDNIDTEDYTYKLTPSTLFVTVAQQPVEASVSGEIEVPFNPQDLTEIPSVVYLTEKVAYGTDFTVELTPVNESQEGYWIKPSDPNNMDESYKEALAQGNLVDNVWSLYTQYVFLGSANVDGFWTSVGTVNAELASENAGSDGYYAYNVTAQLPCSGLYTLTVNKVGTSNFGVKEASQEVTVYPNIFATFGKDKIALGSFATDEKEESEQDNGFNINGQTFTMGSNPDPDSTVTINLPSTWTEKDLANAIGYIPGTYFATSLTTSVPPVKSANQKRNVAGDNAPYRVDMDLNNQTDFTVTVAKNGASHKFNFKVTNTGTSVGSTTGVDTIGAEAGEAVYFNLQGVRVENPEHGIFVKVVDGKATKVVL